MTSRMPGRSILTTTSRPSCKAATCTWAIDAAASGAASKLLKISAIGFPKARSTVAMATSLPNGGTRSCSFDNSSAMSTGSKSRRVDSTCPNLTKIGPNSSRARRSRSPRAAPALRWNQVQGER